MDFVLPPNRFGRYARYGAAIVIAVGVLVGGSLGLARFSDNLPEIDGRSILVDTVRRGPLVHQVRGLGALESEDVLWVPAPVDGRVTAIRLLPGTPVTSESVLIELANPDLELELAEAGFTLRAAEAALDSRRAALQNESLTLEAELVGLEADAEAAQASFEASQRLYEQHVVTDYTLRLDRVKAEGLHRRVEITRRRLKGFRESIPAQQAVDEARVEQLREVVKRTQSRAASLTVQAGMAAVLEQVSVEVGQRVLAGEKLARLVNPRRLKAVLKVAEVQAHFVRIGQPAEIDTHHGLVSGRVTRIDPAASEGNVAVDVALDGPLPEEARPDLSVTGKIEIRRLEDVLTTGRPAIGTSGGTVELFQVVDGGAAAVRVPVELGVASVHEVEIQSGLAEGDRVILTDMSRYDAVDRIRIE